MVLKLYNTLSRQTEELAPLNPGSAAMYACGPTVYDYAHIGNWRTIVTADILRRTLEYAGYQVKHVMNITDVDDKTIAASQGNGEPLSALTRRYEETFLNDLAALNILAPTALTRATEHIGEMIALVQTLLDKGHAYTGSDGVYFAINTFPDYGKLSRRPLDNNLNQEESGSAGKRDPRDFALWKFEKPEDGGNAWDASFGRGRPGWHIECSAMSMKELGPSFDLHVGGSDLIFPHHENEIAQSEAATGQTFANYWVHGAFLLVDGQKMSKSLGNIYTLKNLADQGISPLAFRYWLLTAHYRTPANFTREAVSGAQIALQKLIEFTENSCGQSGQVAETYQTKFAELLANDLDTPQALALAWQLIKDGTISVGDRRATLLDFDHVFGLGLETIKPLTIPEAVQELLTAREAARNAQNWAESDRLREQIEAVGFTVLDTPEGQKVRAK